MTGLFLFLEDVPALIQGLRPAGGESQILSPMGVSHKAWDPFPDALTLGMGIV